MDLRELWERWLEEQPAYEALAKEVERRLLQALRQAGIAARVTSRHKDTASLLKKALRKHYDDPLAQITDKAGARVVVHFRHQVADVEQIVRDLFTCVERENKVDGLGIDRLGYQSLHLDVQLRNAGPALLNRRCEIQVRTLCQDVYAEMSHALLYKTEMALPDETQRMVHCLSALLEVSDRSFEDAAREIRQVDGANVYRLLASLEQLYYQHCGDEYDRALSILVLEKLFPLFPTSEPDRISALIKEFVQTREAHVEHVLATYSPVDDPRYLFLTQPEAFALFYLIEHSASPLHLLWQQWFPLTELEAVATVWGQPYTAWTP